MDLDNIEDENGEGSDEGGLRRRVSAIDLLNNLSALISNASYRMAEVSPSDSGAESAGNLNETTFDTSLAARHEYLGSDLEDLQGRTLHDEGSVIWLPILLELGVVLVPGQTLPLTVFYPPTITMLRDVISKDKTFGVVCMKNGHCVKNALAHYGTTAEVFQFQEAEEGAGFKIKAKGRQRFKLLDQKRPTSGILLGKVLILPEVTLATPLRAANLPSMNRHRLNSNKMLHLMQRDAAFTAWPAWVYQMYDAGYLCERVTRNIKHFKWDSPSAPLPKDPFGLSYWVAQSLPIDDVDRVGMLSLDTAVERLQYALILLNKCQRLFCHYCGNLLADRSDVFPMSVDGPQGAYCNPGGHVHEIMTVYKASGMRLAREAPSTEYSWFPGYGWTITMCSQCNHHTGWHFIAMRTDLKPRLFWGLSRRCVSNHQRDGDEVEWDDALSDE